jgi:hypothetical protein
MKKTAEEILISFIAATRKQLIAKKQSCESTLEIRCCSLAGEATAVLCEAIGPEAAAKKINEEIAKGSSA